MRFGCFPLGETEGTILAHSLRAGRRLIKKGRVLTQLSLFWLHLRYQAKSQR